MGHYKGLLVGAVISNILMAVFTVVSIPAIIPFFDILFAQDDLIPAQPSDALNFSNAIDYLKYYFSQLIASEGKGKALIYVCSGIVLLFFLKNLFRYLSLFFMAPVRTGIVRDLRSDIFGKIVSLPMSFFSEQRKGDLLSRITSDVQEVENSILNVMESVFKEPLIITGALAFMLYVNLKLTFFVFGLILFTAFIIGGISRTLKRKSKRAQEMVGQLVSLTEETLSGMRIVKSFSSEGYVKKRFRVVNDLYRQLLNRIMWRRDLSSPLSEFLGICMVAVLLWYGSLQVFDDNMDSSVFLAFIFAFFNIIDPAKAFSKAYYNIQKGIAAVERIEEILEEKDTVPEAQVPLNKEDFNESIRFENVSFRYQGSGEKVLDGINLEIRKGETVALVGASGAGKSTMVDLIPRFYDPVEGRILMDGKDIRQLAIGDLRSLISMVSQEAILFNDSIEENIRFGYEEAQEIHLQNAAKIAHAEGFILDTSDGYKTEIGDRGTRLSGGQRQRLTIARAILRDAPIMILDEATSALDSESEKEVQEALIEVMRGRTSVVIAHRLSTIQHADRIIVMKDGKIIQEGSHDQLMQTDGEYRKFVALQAF